MIRLGTLAGYPFDGPRVLGGWDPPVGPAIFVVLVRPDPGTERFAVIYVGESEDLAAAGFPFRHPHAPAWVRRAGDKWALHVAWYQVPGGSAGHRRSIAEELCAVYRPSCNDRQFDRSWRPEWIGEYSAPTAGPLTTSRDPGAEEVP